MRHKKLSEAEDHFVRHIRTLEENLFRDQLDPEDSCRMKNERYSWQYRPSHHIETGLLTSEDIDSLLSSGKHLLSVGAFPAYLEQLLCALGIPSENIFVADKDPAILTAKGTMQKVVFDMTDPWPALGTFDVIIFPESLCISLRNKIEKENLQIQTKTEAAFPTDPKEATLLTFVLKEALKCVGMGGRIHANGPMSHPNVMRAVRAQLDLEGYKYGLDYQRYFLSLRRLNES